MAAPTVTGIEPATGPAGTFVTITGTGFSEDISEVRFGAVSAGTRYAFISDAQLVAYVPSGAGTVAVTNSAGETLLSHEVQAGDIWRMSRVRDIPVQDWVKLAVALRYRPRARLPRALRPE